VTWQPSLLELLERWLHSSEGQGWQLRLGEVLLEALSLSAPPNSSKRLRQTSVLVELKPPPLEDSLHLSLSWTFIPTKSSNHSQHIEHTLS
jgi:hypothetical protein